MILGGFYETFYARELVFLLSLNINIMFDVLFVIGYALPRDIGWDLFNFGPSSTVIFETYKSLSFILKFFSAESAALFKSFKTGSAALLTVKSSNALACARFLFL